MAAGVSPDDITNNFLSETPLHKTSRLLQARNDTVWSNLEIMSLLIEKGADPNARNCVGWTPLYLCVQRSNIDGAALLLAAGASPSSETDDGLMPLEYGSPGNEYSLRWLTNKRLLPMLLRGGSPLPRATHAMWMQDLYAPTVHVYRRWEDINRQARAQYVAKVRAAGSWAAYEKAHIARLVPVFEKIFPRPRLPHEIASHVVRFCFHTGHY